MKLKTADFLVLVIASIPLIYWLQVGHIMPDRVPTHWNIRGQADAWQSRDDLPVFLAVLAGVGILLYIILRTLKKIDPKRSAQLNEATAIKVGVGIVTMITMLGLLMLYAPLKGYDIVSGVFLLISLFFAFLGNVMYNIKQNYFIGIRLPWTLDSEDNWTRTHRLAGVLWFVGGICCAALTFLVTPQSMAPVFFTVAISLLIIPSVYSFLLFRRSKG
ncbi:SdpI family protein [Pseudochryseolinea flava]|nr:SdpI family protein [Pseudochryseolinea flava]